MKIFEPLPIPPAHSVLTRASTATQVDDDGLLYTQPADQVRWQDGLPLLEGEATNICWPSNGGAGGWLLINGGTGVLPVVTNNFAAGPGGLTSAHRVVFDKGSSTTSADQSGVQTSFGGTVAGSPTAAAVWIRSNTASSYLMSLDFNGAASNAAGFPSLITVTPAWTRFEIRHSSAADTNRRVVLRLRGSNGTSNFADVLVFGFHQENAASVSSYIPTTTAAATRAADVLTPDTTDPSGGTGPAGGLLLCYVSEYWVPWVESVPYPLGRRITHKGVLYEASQDISGADTLVAPPNSPYWLVVGPDPRVAAFDGLVNTRSYSHPLPELRGWRVGWVVTVTQATDTVLVADIDAAHLLRVRVRASVGGAVLNDVRIERDPGASRLRSQYIITGLNAPAGSVLEIGLSTPINDPDRPGVGLIAWGTAEAMGCTRYGARAGIRDYSRKEPDDFGQVQFVRRAFSKTVSAQLEVEKADINRVSDRLYGLRATPLVWIFSDDPDLSSPLVVYGFYRDFYSTIETPTLAVYSVEVESLA